MNSFANHAACPRAGTPRLVRRRAPWPAIALAIVAATCVSSPARAWVQDVRGSIGFGYSKLFIHDGPSGSLSTSAGLMYPLHPSLSIGPWIAFDLLGSNTVERGSLLASVDYSVFEAAFFARWRPTGWGPIAEVSAGPELVSARAELSTTGGGAAFTDLARQKAVPGFAMGVMLMKTKESPVRVGLEINEVWANLPGNDWFVTSARLAFRY